MRIIKNIVLLLSLIFSSSEVFAQNTFLKYYAHGSSVPAWALKEHPNGDISFLIKGSDSLSQGVDFGIHRIDKYGNSISSRFYERYGHDYAEDFVIHNNQYYLTGSYSRDYTSVANSEKLFYKITENLDTVCKSLYDSLGDGFCRKILYRNDKFYLIGSQRVSSTDLNANLTIVDSNGTILTDNMYGGIKQDWVHGGVFAHEGGLVLIGGIYMPNNSIRLFVVKTDSLGNQQWTKSIQKPTDTIEQCELRSLSIVQVKNGDYYIAGQQESCEFDLQVRSILVCLDSLGNTKWFKTSPFFQGDNSFFEESITEIKETADGNLVCLGGRFGLIPGTLDEEHYDVFLTKFDLLGKKIWTHQYGKTDYHETPYDLILTSDSGYAISGRYAPVDLAQLQIEGVKGLIMKLDACGCFVAGCDPNCTANGIAQESNKNPLKVYPNPATNKLSIESNSSFDSYIIYNFLGEKQLEGKYNESIDISMLAKGMYLIQIRNTTTFSTIKFIKE